MNRSTESIVNTPYKFILDLKVNARFFFIVQIEHSRSGLEPLDVAAIPTMKYNCEAFHSEDDTQ